MKYGVISDTHNHAWSAFGTTNAAGVNSRLQWILDETWRAASEVKAAGGKTLIHCGDLFHVRGSIAPSVLNPTLDLYQQIVKDLGLSVLILAGNHDQESRESVRVSNAVTAMEKVGCDVISMPFTMFATGEYFRFIPWMPSLTALREAIEITKASERSFTTLVIHAPIDGVIPGIPDHGLSPTYLASLGFKRIFSGHYHDYREMAPDVYSVGALTHQTWSDVGSKAGFLLVDDWNVSWRQSHAPSFREITGGMSSTDMLEVADGNYVRARMTTSDPKQIEAMREHILGLGALGVTILAEPPKSVGGRSASAIRSAASLEASVEEFIKESVFEDKPEVALECADILTMARAA